MKINMTLHDCIPAEVGPITVALREIVIKAQAKFYVRWLKNGNWTLIITDKPEEYGLNPSKGFIYWGN